MSRIFSNRSKVTTKNKFGSFLRYNYIYLCLIIIYLPLVVIVFTSFLGQNSSGTIDLLSKNFTAYNYLVLFESTEFINGLVNSLLISFIVVPISVFIGLITCFGIWNKRKSAILIFVNGYTKTSLAMPESITGISLLLLFSSTWIAMGFNLGFFTIVLSHISFCTPYAILTIYPKINKMRENYILASYDLGYNRVKTFFNIVVDFTWPAIISAMIITFAMSLDDFVITSLINGSVTTLSTAIYNVRRGIKAWVVTFGSLIVLSIFFIFIISSLSKVFKNKSLHKKTRTPTISN